MSELKPCPFCGENVEVYKMTRLLGQDHPGFVRCDCVEGVSVARWNDRPIEDELRAELARLNAELLELNDKAVFIKFENEDELPSEIKDDVYSAMFECSHVDGVRLFPYTEENGQKYFLVMLKEDV